MDAPDRVPVAKKSTASLPRLRSLFLPSTCIDLRGIFAVTGNLLFRGEADKRFDGIVFYYIVSYRLRTMPAQGSVFPVVFCQGEQVTEDRGNQFANRRLEAVG
jgi:hypothetical protein